MRAFPALTAILPAADIGRSADGLRPREAKLDQTPSVSERYLVPGSANRGSCGAAPRSRSGPVRICTRSHRWFTEPQAAAAPSGPAVGAYPAGEGAGRDRPVVADLAVQRAVVLPTREASRRRPRGTTLFVATSLTARTRSDRAIGGEPGDPQARRRSRARAQRSFPKASSAGAAQAEGARPRTGGRLAPGQGTRSLGRLAPPSADVSDACRAPASTTAASRPACVVGTQQPERRGVCEGEVQQRLVMVALHHLRLAATRPDRLADTAHRPTAHTARRARTPATAG